MSGRLLSIASVLFASLAMSACSSRPGAATSQPQSPDASTAAAAPVTTAGNQGSAQAGVETGSATNTNVVPCATRDVQLKTGGNSADFNGMSHSGSYLILTNRSRYACSIPGLPQLTFLDANGPVKTTADLPGAKFMQPGPVVLPLVLQPQQSVTTSARWVSGPVFQDNLCYKLTGVTIALRNDTAMTPLVGEMCGERSKGVHYDLQRYGAGTKL